MRTITINAVRLLDTPQSPYDAVAQSGAATARYVACNVTETTVTNADGTTSTVNAFTDYPQATLSGTASVPLTATSTPPASMEALMEAIASQEGLDVTSAGHTDHIYGTEGARLV